MAESKITSERTAAPLLNQGRIDFRQLGSEWLQQEGRLSQTSIISVVDGDKLTLENGRPKNSVEVSAAVNLADGRLLCVSDKPLPGHKSTSFILRYAVGIEPQVELIDSPVLDASKKVEGGALLNIAGSDYVILTTAFGWKGDDAFNRLLIAKAGELQNFAIIDAKIDPSPPDAVEGSLDIAAQLSKAAGREYIKIEGLAAVADPVNKNEATLVFGVRESGPSYKEGSSQFDIISARLTFSEGSFKLTDFRSCYSADINRNLDDGYKTSGIKYSQGIASMEYDPANKRFIVVTSVEAENKKGEQPEWFVHGSYVWTIPEVNGVPEGELSRVTEQNGQPLFIPFKAEALTKGKAAGEWIILADPDRHEWAASGAIPGREANEMPYAIVTIP